MANAKMKTHKGLAKRFKITATGKIMHAKAGKNHLLVNKKRAPKQFKGGKMLHESFEAKVAALSPYGLN